MRTIMKATDGHVLTNGEIYGKTVYLAEGADASAFYEITDEEHAALMESEAAEESDYTAALERFGVQ